LSKRRLRDAGPSIRYYAATQTLAGAIVFGASRSLQSIIPRRHILC